MSGERIIVFIVCMFVDGARAFVGDCLHFVFVVVVMFFPWLVVY